MTAIECVRACKGSLIKARRLYMKKEARYNEQGSGQWFMARTVAGLICARGSCSHADELNKKERGK